MAPCHLQNVTLVPEQMNFQRADTTIIKSIRQISLAREWIHARGPAAIPNFANFQPDGRGEDAPDMMVCNLERSGENVRYQCVEAGRRIEVANDAPMKGRFLDACLDSAIHSAARVVWRACIENKLPVYSIVPTADRDGNPVTLEQLYLPFGNDGNRPDMMVASIHAFSTEGKYQLPGLLRQNTPTAPRHWAVIVNVPVQPVEPAAKVEPAEAPPLVPQPNSNVQVPTRLTSLTFANATPSDRSRV
jgi:hypothetical protein